MIIGAEYMYPRLKYIWKYMEKKDKENMET